MGLSTRVLARAATAAGASVALTAIVAVAPAAGAPPAGPPPGIVVEGGATQPASTLQAAIRETVYVTSAADSDADGQRDRIAVHLLRPAGTAQGLRVATVMHASPYFGVGSLASRRTDLIVPTLYQRPTHATPSQRPTHATPSQRPTHATPSQRPTHPAPHFAAWFDDYFVPRGYAVVEVEMQGTAGSDGCAATGGPDDVASVVAAIDWLAGGAPAAYADGSPAAATWSTGAVGMIGVSYAGALPVAVAETGVAGLATIVPIASISSWYDYARADGIAYGGFGNRYPESLARYVSHSTALTECAARHQRLGDGADDATADLNAFWTERDYRDRVDRVTASVFLVHGQQDGNTKTTQAGRYWDALAARGVPRKLWLHDGGHTDPFVSDLAGRDTVGRWMDHWLYGVDNGVTSEPQATVRRPGGATDTYRTWPGGTATSLWFGGPGDGAAGTLRTTQGPAGTQSFTDNRGQLEYAIVGAPDTAKPNRLVYLTPVLTAPQRLSGAGRVAVTFTTTSTSTPLTAVVVHYTDGSPTRVVTRGALDTKNRASLTSPTPLVPGQETAVTIRLEPKDYVFPAGSRIGVALVANHNEYLQPDTLATDVTVALRPSRAVLPLAAG